MKYVLYLLSQRNTWGNAHIFVHWHANSYFHDVEPVLQTVCRKESRQVVACRVLHPILSLDGF